MVGADGCALADVVYQRNLRSQLRIPRLQASAEAARQSADFAFALAMPCPRTPFPCCSLPENLCSSSSHLSGSACKPPFLGAAN